MRIKTILGKNVIDSAGDELGKVDDIEIDWEQKTVQNIIIKGDAAIKQKITSSKYGSQSMKRLGAKAEPDIVVPISDVENKRLILSKLNNWKDLKEGAYNILEPKRINENIISLDKIDLIIVPGIGFDLNGNRIGHGKGYYDRLLEKSKNSINIGLSFEPQIIDNIQIKNQDIPVDKIITEKRIIER